MMIPLVTATDLERYELPDDVADAFAPSAWMSCADRLARAWGHAYDYETDDMGAAASIWPMDATDLRLYAVACQLDFTREIAPRPVHLPYDPDPRIERWAYVRSDDRGFWDLKTGTSDEVTAWLAGWVAQNVPAYCDECGEYVDDCECGPIGDAERWAR